MTIHNRSDRYGSVARGLHWLTALLILVSWPLGWYAAGLPWDSSEALAFKAQMFSIHKTLGVLAFFTAVIRVIWAFTQVHPDPVNPDHRGEVFMAVLVHYALYLAIILVPLTGWIHHAASEGFAPILLGFGQSLPLVPKSAGLAHAFGVAHVFANYLVLALVLLHVAGALKHVVIDRDGTLARMLTGRPAGRAGAKPRGAAPLAVVIWAAAFAGAWLALSREAPAPAAAPAVTETAGGNWQVQEGDLGISVSQMGSQVAGRFADWQAEITFDPEATTGNRVDVRIATGSLTLGSVSDQATGPEFLNAAAFPEARYQADLRREGEGWIAEGTLTLNERSVAVVMPFTLTPAGEALQMAGETVLDRRAFAVGESYGDEGTVGFNVAVTVRLTAAKR